MNLHKLTINVIRKMQFLQNNVTFFHKIVCIYIQEELIKS